MVRVAPSIHVVVIVTGVAPTASPPGARLKSTAAGTATTVRDSSRVAVSTTLAGLELSCDQPLCGASTSATAVRITTKRNVYFLRERFIVLSSSADLRRVQQRCFILEPRWAPSIRTCGQGCTRLGAKPGQANDNPDLGRRILSWNN